MRILALLPLLILPFTTSSCTVAYAIAVPFEPDAPYGAFRGTVRNVEYSGQNEAVVYRSSGTIEGPMNDGRTMCLQYFYEPEISLAIILPEYPSERTTFDTKSRNVSVRLVRGDWDKANQQFGIDGGTELNDRGGGEQLHGTVTIRYESNHDFDMTLDLSSESGVAFDGQFIWPFEKPRSWQWPGTQSWHKKPNKVDSN